MNKKAAILCFLILLGSSLHPIFAQKTDVQRAKSFIDFLFDVKAMTGVNLKTDKLVLFEDKKQGVMVSNMGVSPLIGATTEFRPFVEEGFLGYLIKYRVDPFFVDRQEVSRMPPDDGQLKPVYRSGQVINLFKGNQGHDLGTEISGVIGEITPHILYNIPKPNQYISSNKLIKSAFVGLGLGIGYWKLKGSMYLTDGEVSEACKTLSLKADESTLVSNIQRYCPRKDIKINSYSISKSAVLGIVYDDNSTFNLIASGPFTPDGKLSAMTILLEYNYIFSGVK